MRTIMIEDLEPARQALREAIQEVAPHIEIIAETGRVVEAASLIPEHMPDLIFLDVELEDGNGFELLNTLGDLDIPVIFTTASEDYAVRAFRFAALDYLLKPIDPDELKVALERLPGQNTTEQIDLLREHMAKPEVPGRIALHTQQKIIYVSVEDITRIEADGNYSKFFLKNEKPLLISKTLKEYDELLSPSCFLRTHQSHLVHICFIKEYIKTDGEYIVLKDGTKIPVSTRRRKDVKEALEDTRRYADCC